MKLPVQHAADGKITRHVLLGEERDLAGLRSGARLAAGDLAHEEHLPDMETYFGCVLVAILDGGELADARVKPHSCDLPDDAFGGLSFMSAQPPGSVHFAIGGLAHEQDAAVAEHRAAHVHLRRGVAGPRRTTISDAPRPVRRARRRSQRRSRAAVRSARGRRVTRKGQADLRDRLDLAGPYQPARLGRHAGSSRFSKNTLVAIAAGAIAA